MTDIRRTILWVIFGFSLVLLWDQWQLHNGNKATFFPKPEVATVAPAPAAPASASGVPAASAAVTASPAPAPARSSSGGKSSLWPFGSRS